MALLIVLAAVLSIVLSRIHMPPLIGFLLAGIIIANYFSPSEDFLDVVEVFSNIGLIMLMFAIGMEIDIRKIKDNGVFAITVAAVALDIVIIVVFPTESDSIFTVVNCIIGLAVVCIIRIYRLKKGTARIAPLPSIEDDPEEPAEPSE